MQQLDGVQPFKINFDDYSFSPNGFFSPPKKIENLPNSKKRCHETSPNSSETKKSLSPFSTPKSHNQCSPCTPGSDYKPSPEELEADALEEILDAQTPNFFASAKSRAREDEKPKNLPGTTFPELTILNQQDYVTVLIDCVASKAYCAKTLIIDPQKSAIKKKLTFMEEDKEKNKESQPSTKKQKKTKSKTGPRAESANNLPFIQELHRGLSSKQSNTNSTPKKSSNLVAEYIKAKQQKNYNPEITYEICHIIANCLGGPSPKAKQGTKNFVLASFDANTVMATIETAILQKPGIAVQVTVYLQPGTRIATAINYQLVSTLPEYPRIMEIKIPGNLSWYTKTEEETLSKKIKKFAKNIQSQIPKSNLPQDQIELPYVLNPKIIATKLTPTSDNKEWQLGAFRPAPPTIERATPLNETNTRSPNSKNGLQLDREKTLALSTLRQQIFELFQKAHQALLEIYDPKDELSKKNSTIALSTALSQIEQEFQAPTTTHLFLPDLLTAQQNQKDTESIPKNLKSPLQTCLLLIVLIEDIMESDMESDQQQIFNKALATITKIAVQLISNGAFLHLTDQNGNHILHHVANLHSEIVWQACINKITKLPKKQRESFLNRSNHQGNTVLDCADACDFETRSEELKNLGATSGIQLQLTEKNILQTTVEQTITLKIKNPN